MPRTKDWNFTKQREQCDTIVEHHATRKFGEREEIKMTSRGEIHYQEKSIREEVRHVRLKENPDAAQQAVGDHQRLDRHILKITKELLVHLNFQVEQDPTYKKSNHCESHSSSITVIKQSEVDGRIVSANWTKSPTDHRRDERNHRGTRQH